MGVTGIQAVGERLKLINLKVITHYLKNKNHHKTIRSLKMVALRAWGGAVIH